MGPFCSCDSGGWQAIFSQIWVKVSASWESCSQKDAGTNWVPYVGFPKWGYPQIIYINAIFHYKPSISGIPHLWKPPYRILVRFPSFPMSMVPGTLSSTNPAANKRLPACFFRCENPKKWMLTQASSVGLKMCVCVSLNRVPHSTLWFNHVSNIHSSLKLSQKFLGSSRIEAQCLDRNISNIVG